MADAGPSAGAATGPTRTDPLVRALSAVVGGPIGTRARPRRFRAALGVLLAVTALALALGLVTKTTCAARGWDDPGRTPFTHLCVSDLPAAYTGLGPGAAWPWSATGTAAGVTADPPLVGLWAWATARVADDAALFTAVNAVGLAMLALLATAALAAARRRRPWDAAGFAAAPVLALSGVVSFDLLPVAAVAGALWAWSRRRWSIAGVLVGLGTAAGWWPILILAAFALTALRDRGRGAGVALLPASGAALAAWLVANAPAFLSGRAQWERSWTALVDRLPDQGSVWTVVDQAVGLSQPTALRLVVVALAVWIALVLWLCATAATPPRISQVAFLLVAGPVLLGLAYQPQHALWLLPLAALARPRWRDLLVWQAGEALYFAMHWWWLGGLLDPSGGGQPGFYWLAIGIRVAATVWLVAVVARDVHEPRRDPLGEERLEPGRAGVV